MADIFNKTIRNKIMVLESKEVVKCITSKEKMGRYYEISEIGKTILDKINGY